MQPAYQCPAAPAVSCTLTYEQVRKRCSCQFEWSQSCDAPVATTLFCADTGLVLPPPSPEAPPTPPEPPRSPPSPPQPPSVPTLYSGDWTRLARSTANTVHILYATQGAPPSGWGIPLARSYAAHEWEIMPAAGGSSLAEIGLCDTAACTLRVNLSKLPQLEGSRVYAFRVRVHRPDVATVDDGSMAYAQRIASRFLGHSTFGPTRATIATLATEYRGKPLGSGMAALSEWTHAQMALPPSLHRAYWRRRANPRLATRVGTGTARSPCTLGARYHRHALTRQELGMQLVLAAGEGGSRYLYVGGVLRTEVAAGTALAALEVSQTYTLCVVDEAINASVWVGTYCAAPQFGDVRIEDIVGPVQVHNPPIAFSSLAAMDAARANDARSAPAVMALSGSAAATLDALVPQTRFNVGVRLLQRLNVSCPLSPEAESAAASRTTYLEFEGDLYRFDPRLRLLNNTLASPTANLAASDPAFCPSVPKTFLNAATCVRALACSSVQYGSVPITLSAATLRDFYTKGGSYVYYVSGLRLEGPYAVAPCVSSAATRWKRLSVGSGGSGASGGCDGGGSAIGFVTLASLRSAIRDAEQGATNTGGAAPVVDVGWFDCASSAVALGARVEVDGVCWQHVHPQELSVWDFSYWVLAHPGSTSTYDPIRAVALAGSVELRWPATHSMSRWKKEHTELTYVGRHGEQTDFASLPRAVQSAGMADAVGAVGGTRGADDGAEACGSPGEVSNEPPFGHRFHIYMTGRKKGVEDMVGDRAYSDLSTGKVTVHNALALSAPDQLRQRVAWALSQIFVISEIGFPRHKEHETWHAFYDIFVRHAFGRFRDLVREVSYAPQMGAYLTYRRSRSFAADASNPDENFAREIMQLFTVGLYELNDDGTAMLGDKGRRLQTYGTHHIMSFARIWTGFSLQLPRGNLEQRKGDGTPNHVDPMLILPNWHDLFPKMNLHDGYIGDGYPLCADLPAHQFLRIGASWRYLGRLPLSQLQQDPSSYANTASQPILAPRPTSSALFAALCNRPSGGARCAYGSEITLTANLPCDALECELDVPRVARIADGSDVVYFEYVPPPCVEWSYFDLGKLGQRRGQKQCLDPATSAAAVACCPPGDSTGSHAHSQCRALGERLTYATAAARCAASSLTVCQTFSSVAGGHCDLSNELTWQGASCSVQLEIDHEGHVNAVHSPAGHQYVAAHSGNTHRVRWEGGRFPAVATGCASGCSQQGSSCLCPIQVQTAAVFSDTRLVPSVTEIEANLFVGSAPPDAFDHGTYVRCASAACSAAWTANGIEVFIHAASAGGSFDARTIFAISSNHTQSGRRYLLNKASSISVGSTPSRGYSSARPFRFRSPPTFMKLRDPAQRDAQNEVEALLDHLVFHRNAAPFIAHRLIQRLTTSNPTPRYVRAVVEAFRKGSYGGRAYTDRPADLGAAVAAILLDREAVTPVLDADPHHGGLREPHLKMLHLMRAMELRTVGGREMELKQLGGVIGQQQYASPSVFSFFLPEYQPPGAVAAANMHAPEAMLATSPLVLGFLNGAISLVRHGLVSCEEGFGAWRGTGSCDSPSAMAPDAVLAYAAPSVASGQSAAIVEDLSLLLTSGRLNAHSKHVIADAYEQELANSSSAANALKLAQQMVLLSAEFHSTNENALLPKPRQGPSPPSPSLGRPYKAIVMLFLQGGADTFNMLMPYGDCSSADLAFEYASTRSAAAVSHSVQRPIAVPSGTQPCDTFALHPSMPTLHSLYGTGEAAFIANIGTLIEPMTKQQYLSAELGLGSSVQMPPSLFAHNLQTSAMSTLHPQAYAAAGVLGRMLTALDAQASPASPRFRSAAYSLKGVPEVLEGWDRPPEVLDAKSGVIRLHQHAHLADHFARLHTNESASIFSATATRLLAESLRGSEALGSILSQMTLNVTFPDSELGWQLKQVSRLIRARSALGSERDVFFVQVPRFDTHSDSVSVLEWLFGDVDTALGAFVAEMKAQGTWDSVVVQSVSEFGRALVSNGQGTDHGWAGNHFTLGGKVRGGRIHGRFPSTLRTDGPLSIGRAGRLIPTTAWEGMWKPLAQWFGVHDERLADVMPNLANFEDSYLLTKDQLMRD